MKGERTALGVKDGRGHHMNARRAVHHVCSCLPSGDLVAHGYASLTRIF